MTESIHNFRIAGFGIKIIFKDGPNNMNLLPSFSPFSVDTESVPSGSIARNHSNNGNDTLFELVVDDSLSPTPKAQRELIRDFPTGNGNTRVDRLPDGGYQYIIKDIYDNDCCLLISDKTFAHCRCALNGTYNMRAYGLNNALMLVFAFAGARRQTLLVHASLVRQHGYGYAFTAKSGTGKSTQVSMWLRYLPDCDLMNDDNPIIRIINGQPIVFGGPWSGKTPCYRNVSAPLAALTRIDRAQANSIDRLNPIEAFASILPSMSSMKWDKETYDCVCDTVAKLVETVGCFTLHCLPDRESAIICNKAIRKA